AVPRADVLHRVDPVHVLRTGQDGHPRGAVGVVAVDVVGVEVVHHRVAGDDVDTSQVVDELDQPLEPDPDVVVDVDPEVLLDRPHGRRRPAVGVRDVDLVLSAAGQRDPEVTGDREHGDRLGGGV